MIVGTGIDVVDIIRFEAALSRRPAMAQRLFTHTEWSSVGRGRASVPRLAARFAAKEAFIKAAGGLHGGRWTDIEVIRVADRAPTVNIQGQLGQWILRHNLVANLSLSHERLWAAAMVILERG